MAIQKKFAKRKHSSFEKAKYAFDLFRTEKAQLPECFSIYTNQFLDSYIIC
jgi:hypothetical protein